MQVGINLVVMAARVQPCEQRIGDQAEPVRQDELLEQPDHDERKPDFEIAAPQPAETGSGDLRLEFLEVDDGADQHVGEEGNEEGVADEVERLLAQH